MDPSAGTRGHLVAVPDDLADAGPELAGAMEAAGRFLARRDRSTREVRDHLFARGFERETVDVALERLTLLGLVDDLAFARSWIADRAVRKGLAAEALIRELRAKGVERAVAQEAWDETGLDETERAVEVAARFAGKVARLPLEQQGVRLVALLARRGFSREAAVAGARAVLPPEGWD